MAEKCAGKAWGDHDWYPCRYTGKYEEVGKWWCGHHLPSRRETQRTAREDKWQAEWDASEARIAVGQAEAAEWDRRAALYPDLVAILHEWYDECENEDPDDPVTEDWRLQPWIEGELVVRTRELLKKADHD